MPAKRPSRLRSPWLIAWAVLVVAASTMHAVFWLGEPRAEGIGASEWLRRLFNALYTPSSPFSLAAQIGLDIWGPRPLWQAILLHAVTWAVLLAVLAGLVRLRRRLLVRRPRRKPFAAVEPDVPVEPLSRRRVLVEASFGLLGTGAAGVYVAGTCVTPWDLRIARYSIPIADLSTHLEGLRLVQISDTHLGPRIPADYIRRAIRTALDLRPDVFLVTGDYVHNGPLHIPLAVRLFQPLIDSGRPVIGVLGNHDWYADGPLTGRLLRELGVRMIDNARLFLADKDRLTDEDDGRSLCIAGLGDLKTAVVDPKAALAGVAITTPRLLISHNPDTAELAEVQAHRVDLMISGHYHGGQIKLPVLGYLPFIRSPFGTKYFGGVVQGPAFRVLISRGVGMSIVPIRLGVPPELVEITLTRA